MEIILKITVEAPGLTAAINNLAAALGVRLATAPSLLAVQTTQSAPSAAQSETSTSLPAAQSAPPLVQTTAAVPVAPPPQYTQDQIMQAGAKLMDAGKANELIALLRSFNVRAVMELKPEQLGAFATAMRELGAEI